MDSSLYQLKVTLKGIRPPVWRRIRVPADLTLARLHDVLQVTMGWTDSHLHMFVVDGISYGEPDPDDHMPVTSERRVRLYEVLVKQRDKLRYDYDFGDGWEHDVVLESVHPAEPGPVKAVCLTGKRACPPEDCGGPWGYEELLETLSNPANPEYEEKSEWLGGELDPEDFHLDEVNQELAKMRFPRRRGAVD